MKPLTPNRAICEGDTGNTQRPSKDKTVIWRTCRAMTDLELTEAAQSHQSLAWRSVAEQLLKERQADDEAPKIELGDSAPQIQVDRMPRHRKAKKHKSVWTRKWSSVR
jgi:hypothetical protein